MSSVDYIKCDEYVCQSCAYAYCHDHKFNICRGCHLSLHES